MNKSLTYLVLLLMLNTISFSQKPRKIFSALQEKKLTDAIIEYQKIDATKNYDIEELTLFELSKCLFMIDSTYNDYNPIASIKNFNKTIQNPVFSQKTDNTLKEVNEFLSKYETSITQIENNIHQKIVFQAKKINTIEAYSRALEVTNNVHKSELELLKEEASYKVAKSEMSITGLKSFISNYSNSKHITEVQFLLEKLLLETAQKKQSIEDLNAFIKEYNSSVLIPKAIDFRDSIVLLRTPKEYESIQTFINTYPNSKFNVELKASLPNLLYKESIEKNTIESLQKFINTFPSDARITFVKEQLEEKKITIVELDDVYFCSALINYYHFDNNLIPIVDSKKFNKKRYIDTLGNLALICDDFYEIDEFKEGLARVSINIGGSIKMGFIDYTGKIKIPTIYDYATPFENNLSIVKLNNKEGIIDKAGNIILPAIYESLSSIEGNFVCFKSLDTDRYGVLDLNGNEILPAIYDVEILIREKLAYCHKDNKGGVIDLNSKINIVIPFIYDGVTYFENEMILVSLNGKYGVINRDGKIVIPIKYELITQIDNNLFYVQLNNKSGVLDKNNNIILPNIYDGIDYDDNDLFSVELKNKFGYVDKKGSIIIPTIYDAVNHLTQNYLSSIGVFIAESNGKWGGFDIQGKISLPFLYDDINYFSNDLIAVRVKGKYGLINKNTRKIVLPFEYDSFEFFGLGGRGIFTKNDMNKSFHIKQNW